jgi:hypothetical protein
MEFYLASAVIGLGYFLSKQNPPSSDSPLASIPSKNKPNGENILNSNRVQEIRLQEQELSDKLYQQAWNNPTSNLVIPGPWESYYNCTNENNKMNKVDYVDNTLPIEFMEKPDLSTEKKYGYGHSTSTPVSDGHYGISLTGEPIDPKHFSHNNMQPFFGGHVRQNMDETTNQAIVENFTGQFKYDRKKDEIPYLFDPQANVDLPNGSPPLTLAYGKERFIASNIRNNEAPTEKIYVGPGLNCGYTWKPSGGFQQANKRDYILPKTVDELRVKTNPKVTYYMPVLPGSHPSRPGKIGVVQKNRPDSFAVWSPERYFVTTGDRMKPKQRAEIVLKHSNRTTTDIRQSMGPAGPASNTKENLRANIRISDKCQYTPGGPRGLDAAGKWKVPDTCEPMSNYVPMKRECPGEENFPSINNLTDPESKVDPYADPRNRSCYTNHDYGKRSFQFKPNNRESTSCLPAINLTGVDQANYVPITSELRPSRKQNVVGNARWTGNVQGPHNRHRVWDPNDIPRTTIKETTLQSAPAANVGVQRPPNPRIYDPNDIPRTTIKETTLSEGILGSAYSGDNLKPRTHDPTDVLKTTNKETTLSSYSGDPYFPNQDKRESNCYDMKNTVKQFTSVNEHFGVTTGEQEGGYKNRTIDPRSTNRQYTSVHEYTGNAGSGDSEQPTNRSMYDNVTTHSYRETLSRGRTPGRQGPKDNVDPSMITQTTKRAGDLYNQALSSRPQMSTKVYNSLPQVNKCSETKKKMNVPNIPLRNRLDGRILDAFKSNPYTQSLESYVF